MTAVQSAAPVPAATDAVALACLQVPAAGTLAALQARLVDRIKRAATRQLHASPGGERLCSASITPARKRPSSCFTKK